MPATVTFRRSLAELSVVLLVALCGWAAAGTADATKAALAMAAARTIRRDIPKPPFRCGSALERPLYTTPSGKAEPGASDATCGPPVAPFARQMAGGLVRSSTRRILPVAVFGSSGTTT